MGKYASRESTGVVVGWDDVTGKPTTFTPIVHGNAHHSTAYAPIANPVFTGKIKINNTSYFTVSTKYSAWDGWLGLNCYGDDTANSIKLLTSYIDDGAWAINIGWTGIRAYFWSAAALAGKVAGDVLTLPDPYFTIGTTGNLTISGNVIGSKLQTANWSLEEDGNDLIIKRGSTVLARLSSTGFWTTKDDQDSHDSTP